jgi:hypothetical protein
MMTIHRIVLKTHPLLTTHVRSVHSILLGFSKRRSAAKDRPVAALGWLGRARTSQ